MRIVIVDDEPLARDCIRLVLESLDDVEVVGEFGHGAVAVEGIQTLEPDLVFLDIQMPGMTGFDVIDVIGPDKMPSVIFVTAHDQFALRAFEVHALDYLLKPFDDEQLVAALDRAGDLLGSPPARATLQEQLQGLLAEVARNPPTAEEGGENVGRYATRLAIRQSGRIRYVVVNQVAWFEASGNYVRIHVGKESYRLRATLTALHARLDPSRFARIHRSRIVNLDHVHEVQPWVGGDYVAIMKDGQQLRVSRMFREAVLSPIR